MDQPVKSENDKRLYRVITLENGLTALLISDVENLKENHNDMCLETEEDITDNDCSGSEDDTEDEDVNTEELEEGREQTSDYVEMSYGGRVKKVRGEKKSAAALCVGVGSFSDPPDIPGLAHFLEHMVFMGSEKYPKENDFDDFLSRHGGESNAWTDCERTCFHFEVEQKYFHRALDKFAQFFISPLLLRDSVDREIEAVDNEFKMTIQQDSERVNQLLAFMAKPGHPMTKFLCGNVETLKHLPAEKNVDIYDYLEEFYRKFYSAHIMTLAVHSRDNLDVLEDWVRNIFAGIPNNKTEKQSFGNVNEPFCTQAFHKLYKVIPVENIHKLEVTWPLPSMIDKYRCKPLRYLSTLISHEGAGSILSYLKKRLWALELIGGNGYGGFELNTTWSAFSLTIILTDLGVQHVKEILCAVFGYIQMLQNEGPQDWLFEEEQKLAAAKFRWKEQGDAAAYVENVSEYMQLFQTADYLTGRHLAFYYDKQLIQDCLDKLRPENCNVMVLSNSFKCEVTCDQTEHWYGTKYAVCDFDPEWLDAWKEPEKNPEFYLPQPNPYIATDFDLKEVDQNEITKHPRVVVDNSHCKIWYKKDTHFHVPKGLLFVHLITPVVLQSLESTTLLDLYIDLLLHSLNEKIYPAVLAGFEYSLSTQQTGLTLSVTGFSHKLPIVFDTILTHMNEFTVTQDVFEAVRDQLKKTYYNEMIKPYYFARMLRFSAIEPVNWPLVQRYQVVDSLTCEMLQNTVKNFLHQLFAECLVIGNFTPEEAQEFGCILKSRLLGPPLGEASIIQKCLLQLPEKQAYCQVRNFNMADSSSCVTNYYQSEPGTLYTSCLNELLGTRIKEPCFNILRTQHQLGYSVFALDLVTNGILGLTITVECQATKFSMHEIDEHIQQFICQFKQTLEETTQEEFTSQVNSLVAVKRCEDSDLAEEAGRWWKEIQDQTYLFDRTEKEIAILQSLTLESLTQWYSQYVQSTSKKLSVQVVGKSDVEESMEISVDNSAINMDTNAESKHKQIIQDVNDKQNVCHFMTDEKQSAEAIIDIAEFKKSLQHFPVTKILS